MLLNRPATFTDFYELTMAQGYYLAGRTKEKAIFDYFFRKLPFQGGYVIFAGLSDFLQHLEDYRFHEDELDFLARQNFDPSFLDFLSDFRFNGQIYAAKEGEIVFPNEPVVRLEGNLIETQLLETILLNMLNFESLIATKASRIRQAGGNRGVLDFGLRRAQGFGGLQVSKAAIIGGLDGTSNVYTGMVNDINISGTMAHSWVQSFPDELSAFRSYARHYPDSCILLVDTYNTLAKGIPNAIKVAKELEEKGHKLVGIRLDSGDLAYLSRKARKMLDEAGLGYVKIAASNQLDEHLIKSLLDQGAPIDLFGVGTKLATAYDHPALDGVYKLSAIDQEPTLKVSDNIEKITLPGRKSVTRFLDDEGKFFADGVHLQEEESFERIYHPFFPMKNTTVAHLESYELLELVYAEGALQGTVSTAAEAKSYASEQLNRLNPEHKRFDNPHVYRVGISEKLMNLRDSLIQKSK